MGKELEHVANPAIGVLVGCMAIEFSADELEHIADELKDAAAAKRKGEPVATPGVCRVCGCTDEEGCEPFGCWWVEPDLCSVCASELEARALGPYVRGEDPELDQRIDACWQDTVLPIIDRAFDEGDTSR